MLHFVYNEVGQDMSAEVPTMGKAMFLLVAFLVLGVVFILFKGSQVAVPIEGDSAAVEGPNVPDLRLNERASEAGDALKSGAKKAVTAANNALSDTKPSTYKFDREVVDVKIGEKAELRISRLGDMKALRVQLTPAPGSSITASGGEFRAGEASVFIYVEAKPGAQDASLTVRAGDFTKIVPVRVSK